MSLKIRLKSAISPLLGITLVAAILPVPAAQAAGTLPIAMAQQIDVNGQPLAGCIVNFFVAGTVASPQNSYSDFSLTQNPNNQLTCDQTGRVPMFWLADGLVHVRLTDANGVPVIDTTMQVLGPSSGGGGGGGTVDPTTIAQTGDLKARYGTGVIAGWVRCNGLTIGNASSGGTERANADTQNAFVYLYITDPNLVVSGGRTGNALNDYNANKTIATPDWRGRALAFLDDMGNSAAGRLTAASMSPNGTTLGAVSIGTETITLAAGNIPSLTSSRVQTIKVNPVGKTYAVGTNGVVTSQALGTPGGAVGPNSTTGDYASVSDFQADINIIVNYTNPSPIALVNVWPAKAASLYLKL